MRASLLVLGVVVVAARVAEASTVVVLSDPDHASALGSALQVTLAGRGVAIATLPAPDGNLRLDRAAAAQHAAISFNADAALWIDSEPDATEVCAVSADGRYFRHAPLPVGEGDTSRLFAAIATSLLDELLAPPDAPALDVDVHLHLDPHGGASARPLVATPGLVAAPGVVVAAPVPVRPHADRTVIEIGPMVSPVTYGVEAEVAMPLTPSTRFGVFGLANFLTFKNSDPLLGGGAELRRVGHGMHHFDVGAIGGAATLSNDTIVFGGARLSYVWDGPGTGLALSVTPVLVASGMDVVPGAWASLRWELPL